MKGRTPFFINFSSKNSGTAKKILDDATETAIEQLVGSGLVEQQIYTLLPDLKNVQTMIYRARRSIIPKQVKNLKDLKLSNPWLTVREGINEVRFLLSQESRAPTEKICVWITDNFLDLLCEMEAIYSDGTFFTCPSLFSQMYTIHGMYRDKMICLAYALLPGKDTATYTEFLRILKDAASAKGKNFNPMEAQTDFEKSMQKALRYSFPGIRLRGYLFHHCQAIMKRLKNYGLWLPYKNNPEVKLYFKRIMALALVPIGHQEELYRNILMPNIPPTLEAGLEKFKAYYREGRKFATLFDPFILRSLFGVKTLSFQPYQKYNQKINIQCVDQLSLHKLQSLKQRIQPEPKVRLEKSIPRSQGFLRSIHPDSWDAAQ